MAKSEGKSGPEETGQGAQISAAHDLEVAAGFPLLNPQPVLRVSETGKLLFANPASESLLKNWGSSVGGDAPEELRTWVMMALHQQTAIDFELAVDGLLYRSHVVPAESGTEANIYCRDVTQRVQAERQLRERERQLRETFANIPGMVYRCKNDAAWTLEQVSAGCLELTGYSTEEYLNGKVRFGDDVIIPAHQLRVWDEVQAALARRGRYVLEYMVKTKDGREKWVWEQGSGVFDDGGALLALEGLILDDDLRHRSQSALESRNKELALLGGLAQSLASVESYAQLQEVLSSKVQSQLGLCNIGVFRLDAGSNTLVLELVAGLYIGKVDPGWSVKLGQGIIGSCAELARPLVVNDTSHAAEFFELEPGSIRSEAAFPLVRGGKVVGVINFDSAQTDNFPDESIDTLMAIAVQINLVLERVRLLAGLRESEERYRSLSAVAPVGIFRTDAAGGVLFVNEQLCEMCGLGEEELRSGGWREILHPDDVVRLRPQVVKTLAQGEPFLAECRLKKPDGGISWALVNAQAEHGPQGEICGMVGTLTDISDQKQAVERVAAYSRQLRQVIDLVPHYIFAKDDAGRYILANQAVAEAYGTSVAELVGKRDSDFPSRPIGAELSVQEESAELGRSMAKQVIEELVTDACGAERTLQTVNMPYLPPGADRPGLLSVSVDITELREQQAATARNEERLRAVIDNAYEAIVLADSNGLIEVFSPSAERIFGYKASEMIGRNVNVLMQEPEASAHDSYLRRFMETGQARVLGLGREVVGRKKSGEPVALQLQANKLEISGETKFLAMLEDLTERKAQEARQRQFEEQMQQAQKMESLGLLAGGIAHDFNNLLVGVLGNVGLAMLDLPEESPVRPVLQSIETAALRAAELTRQMLAYSGRGKFVVEPIRLDRIVEEMTHLLHTVISKRAVLRMEFAPDVPAISADATQVRQIVMNLITNASDAIGDKSGYITIRTGMLYADEGYLSSTYISGVPQPGNYVFLDVSDTGVGMDRDTMARIFDPFFSTKFTGRGLGLAAVLGIVRGHGGTLKVYSEPGKGTTFRVLFPCQAEVSVEPSAQRSEAGLPASLSGRVLLAEDDDSVGAVTRAILIRAGLQVELVADGVEAMEALLANPSNYDLIVADLTMPRMGGEELFKHAKLVRGDLPVVLTSGYNELEIMPEFEGQGLAGFVQKPFTPEDLLQAVAKALGLSKAEDSG